MNVYAPSAEPLVVFVGPDAGKTGLRSLLMRFVGATGLLAVLDGPAAIGQSVGKAGLN